MRVTLLRHLEFMQAPILAKIANRLCAVRSRVLACLNSIRAEELAATSHIQEVFSFSVIHDIRFQSNLNFIQFVYRPGLYKSLYLPLQSRKFGPDFES